MQVGAMQLYSEIQRGHEYANEMRRVNKNLKECQQLSFTYNNRERLFGMPITNVGSSSFPPAIIGSYFGNNQLTLFFPVSRIKSCQLLLQRILTITSHRPS